MMKGLRRKKNANNRFLSNIVTGSEGCPQMTDVLSKKNNCGSGFCCNTWGTGRLRDGEGFANEEMSDHQDFVTYRH